MDRLQWKVLRLRIACHDALTLLPSAGKMDSGVDSWGGSLARLSPIPSSAERNQHIPRYYQQVLYSIAPNDTTGLANQYLQAPKTKLVRRDKLQG